MSEKLKPCPFCGAHEDDGRSELEVQRMSGDIAVVRCLECECEGPVLNQPQDDVEATTAWNRRATEPEGTEDTGMVEVDFCPCGNQDCDGDHLELEDADADVRPILCRVFDDEPDELMTGWREWYKPDEWLHWSRALGAFIRQRLGKTPFNNFPSLDRAPEPFGVTLVVAEVVGLNDELRDQVDDLASALEEIRDCDDGAWAAGKHAPEARAHGVTTARSIAAAALTKHRGEA